MKIEIIFAASSLYISTSLNYSKPAKELSL